MGHAGDQSGWPLPRDNVMTTDTEQVDSFTDVSEGPREVNVAVQGASQSPTSYVPDLKNGTETNSATGVVSELREPRTGRFVKGHAALAGGGRPKKGERLLDYVNKLVEKAPNKQAVAEAHLDRLLKRDAVGARAFVDHRDTYFGIPKQTLVVEHADAPGLAWLQALATGQGVEGEAREMPSSARIPDEHPADE